MRIRTKICACAVLLLGVTGALAQQPMMGRPAGAPGPRPGMGPMGGAWGRRGRMMMGASGPRQMMGMGPLMQKQVVPTSDGGVVVVIGNRLIKYDKNLKKIGEAEINISQQAMADMHQKMTQCCKMMMQKMAQPQPQNEENNGKENNGEKEDK